MTTESETRVEEVYKLAHDKGVWRIVGPEGELWKGIGASPISIVRAANEAREQGRREALGDVDVAAAEIERGAWTVHGDGTVSVWSECFDDRRENGVGDTFAQALFAAANQDKEDGKNDPNPESPESVSGEEGQ